MPTSGSSGGGACGGIGAGVNPPILSSPVTREFVRDSKITLKFTEGIKHFSMIHRMNAKPKYYLLRIHFSEETKYRKSFLQFKFLFIRKLFKLIFDETELLLQLKIRWKIGLIQLIIDN